MFRNRLRVKVLLVLVLLFAVGYPILRGSFNFDSSGDIIWALSTFLLIVDLINLRAKSKKAEGSEGKQEGELE